jgi:adenylyltransferase/sulfurtransferase
MSIAVSFSDYFSRPQQLPGFGVHQQAQLQKASVLVIGAGGLGCPLIQYIAASGIGKITVIDDDQVQATNLHRQLLYSVSDIGQSKVAAIQSKWAFPFTQFTGIAQQLTNENALALVSQFDVIVDTTDNFQTRYLVNDACVAANKPFVSASIFQFEGQLSVYNYLLDNGVRSGTYRCLFPSAPENAMNCSEAGVLATTAGFIGLMQANEVLKVVLRDKNVLANQLLVYKLLSNEQRFLVYERDEQQFQQAALAFEKRSLTNESNATEELKEISAEELKALLANSTTLQLIDVRESWEHEIENIGGQLISLSDLIKSIPLLTVTAPVILYCEKGERSRIAQQRLAAKGFLNTINLKGGLKAWRGSIKK